MDISPISGFFITGFLFAPLAGMFGYWLHKRSDKWLSTSLVVLAACPLGLLLMWLRQLAGMTATDVAWMGIIFGIWGYVWIYIFLYVDSPVKDRMTFWSYMQGIARAKKIIKTYDGPEDHVKEFIEENYLKGTLRQPEVHSGAFETWFAWIWNGFIFTLMIVGLMSVNSLGDLI